MNGELITILDSKLQKITDPLIDKILDLNDLVNEINYEVFNDSLNYRFEVRINRSRYTSFEIESMITKQRVPDISIDFVIDNGGFTRISSIIYTDSTINKLTKESVLEWMTYTIFTENLSC